MKWQDPKVSFLEGLWARGDRSFSRLLVHAFKNGCRFDGWSDRFKYSRWDQSLSECGIDTAFYTTRKRELEETLPWDHIDSCVNKTFLKKEWEQALKEAPTGDCRWESCNECGVCDFEDIAPDLSKEEMGQTAPDVIKDAPEKQIDIRLCFSYSKTGEAKFFGHLEMVNIFLRALRRLAVPLLFSKGFHPMPKVSFDDPLPIGMESLEERFFVSVSKPVDTDDLTDRLNQEVPVGLSVKDCSMVSEKRKGPTQKINHYVITLQEGIFEKEMMDRFHRQPSIHITRTNKKGRIKTIDLKEVVFRVDFLRQNSLRLDIKEMNGKMVRPAEFLSKVFELSDVVIKKASIIKGKTNV
jgi:radical SAM-linked protein